MKRIITLVTLSATVCLTATAALAERYVVYRPAPVRDHRAPTIVTSYWPISGTVGTVVTITGDNFARGTKVLYGSMLVTPTRVADKTITFHIPRHAADAKIALSIPSKRRALTVGMFDVRRAYTPSYVTHGRLHRRGNSVALLRARWDCAFLASPQVKAELSLHANRIARLQRMLILATNDSKLCLRIKLSMQKENTRHDRRMTALKASFRMS